ncbi:DUF4241 domain-containing protein [Paracoccus sp. S1E-3]|uniref:DUF4241 domain-containing protein n=1 Tax=Paracoccus sp. S1E-3 TaxID=2756130 RepID=UPI0015EF796D|nr:DUF4241 domain-containing protein [Paracoccus sp. S1E-3]MBA4489894.1 DUF4241 domain-containing protein [Paracoccus sp. S1E-3]
MRSWPLAALLALWGLIPVGASARQVADWLVAQSGAPREIRQVARFTPDSPKILGADPLTYAPGYPFDFIAIPPGPVEVVALLEPVEGRVALAAMIFVNAAPACGGEAGAIWVDSGTASFLTPATAASLNAMRQDYQQRGLNLYDDYFADPAQMGDSVFARMLTLPDGSAFPGFSSGWGDGAYPVVTLYDAQGKMLALYADFIGNDQTEGFILPPPCQTAGT